MYKALSFGTDAYLTSVDTALNLSFSANKDTGNWSCSDVHASAGYLVAGKSVQTGSYIGDFPVAEDTLNTSVTHQMSEDAEIPPVAGHAYQDPNMLFTSNMTVALPTGLANVMQDFVGHTFNGSFVLSVSLYGSDIKSYVPAENWSFNMDLSDFLSIAAISSCRYVGNNSQRYYYRIFVSGILRHLPPIQFKVWCGALTSFTTTSSSLKAACDFNISGHFFSTAVTVEAEAEYALEPVTPESSSPEGGPRFHMWHNCVEQGCYDEPWVKV